MCEMKLLLKVCLHILDQFIKRQMKIYLIFLLFLHSIKIHCSPVEMPKLHHNEYTTFHKIGFNGIYHGNCELVRAGLI